MELLITHITHYKEKDAIINGFNNSGVFSILAKGILSAKSKNASLNNPMTIADIELSDNSKSNYLILKASSIIFSPMELFGSLNSLASVMLLNELINKCLSDQEKIIEYNAIVSTLKKIKNNTGGDYFALLNIIGHILKNSGYDFTIDECVFCKTKKDIVTFSFNDGGFVCKNCLTNSMEKPFNSQELLIIRNIFKNDPNNVCIINVDKISFLKILKRLIVFIEDNFGIKIRNYELFVD